MNYQCQFLVTDNVTGVLYESFRQTFYHEDDIVHLKWKDVFFIITNNTPQTFHVYLEPYVLEGLVLQSGRVHWFSAPFENKMSDECTKVHIAGKRVKITLFMNHVKRHQHKLYSVLQYIRPSVRSIVLGRAQLIYEETDQKRVYTWLSQKDPIPFPGVRLLKQTQNDSIPDNPYYSNEARVLPIVIDPETVLEMKFYNQALFLFEIVIKQNLFNCITPRVSPRQRTFCPELQTYTFKLNEFFVFELDYYFAKGAVTILTARIIASKYKVGLNLEHNKGGVTV